MAGAIARGVAVGVLEVIAEGTGHGTTSNPSRPATECEIARGDWFAMHPDTSEKPPPQLRCGPKGEWGIATLAQ